MTQQLVTLHYTVTFQMLLSTVTFQMLLSTVAFQMLHHVTFKNVVTVTFGNVTSHCNFFAIT